MLELTLGQFLVSLCMSLAGLCIFIWAVLSGHVQECRGHRRARLSSGGG